MHIDLKIVPGVNTEKTLAANETGVAASSFIRWRDGMAEKRGGWSKYVPHQFSSKVKALHPWQDVNGSNYLGVGSLNQLAYVKSGQVVDISAQYKTQTLTPAVATDAGSSIVTVTATGANVTTFDSVVIETHTAVGGVILYGAYQVYEAGVNSFKIDAGALADGTDTPALPVFAFTSGSAEVTVTLANHGYFPGDYFPVLVATAFTTARVTLSGAYLVKSTPTSDTFTIQAPNKAAGNETAALNAGLMVIDYYLSGAPPQQGSGYGIGGYGLGGYGLNVAVTPTPNPSLVVADYWLDNWGEVLLACPTNGGLFAWSPQTGNTSASLVPTAPTANKGMLVVMPQQQVMLWGSTYNGVSDPGQIRWSDAGDYSTWLPQATNQAGGYHIPTGSAIVRVIQIAQQVLVLTDVDCYAGQYVGAPIVWGFSRLASGCGLIAPKAVATQAGVVYWMSQKNFFVKGPSGVQILQSPVWDAVFQNMNTAAADNIVCASNAMFGEITWFYPSAASAGENDSYVCYNTLTGLWDMGAMNRTAWTDQSILGGPIGAADGWVYQHETSPDADGAPITAWLETGYATLSEGQDLLFCDLVYPDMKWQTYANYVSGAGEQVGTYTENEGGMVGFQFNVADYLGQVPRRYGPYYVNRRSLRIPVRFRGRYVQVRITSKDLGSFWRVGKIRLRVAADGRR